jgi:hypothetical protein
VEPESHQRLARSGGRVQDHVLAAHDLEERLFLRRIELQPDLGHPFDEEREDLVRVGGAVRRDARGEERAGGCAFGRPDRDGGRDREVGHGRGHCGMVGAELTSSEAIGELTEGAPPEGALPRISASEGLPLGRGGPHLGAPGAASRWRDCGMPPASENLGPCHGQPAGAPWLESAPTRRESSRP